MQDDRDSVAFPNTSKVQEAVANGIEAYLSAEATGVADEEAFAIAFGRAVERYLESLEAAERVRVLLGLHRPGVRIPEKRMLPEDAEGRKKTLEAAADLYASGKLCRVRSRKDGRIFWVKADE